ncbi:MAG: hypothetical protein LAN84_00420 [Acidobacteriia bacterium]|nr:hypothetical protein [Terriglobia bacterium]
MTRVWISFKLNDRRLKAKTDTWEVWSLDVVEVLHERTDEVSHLGQIRWYSGWRKYCFFPAAQIVFEQDCLRHIADFIESETAKHRKGRRA